MTTDLDRLIEAVEGDCVNWLGWVPRDDVIPGELWAIARDADRGSLDSAVVLLEALLPGWEWAVYGRGTAHLWKQLDNVNAGNFIPARALLLATLRAYRSTREGA